MSRTIITMAHIGSGYESDFINNNEMAYCPAGCPYLILAENMNERPHCAYKSPHKAKYLARIEVYDESGNVRPMQILKHRECAIQYFVTDRNIHGRQILVELERD